MSDLKEKSITMLREVKQECDKHEYCDECPLSIYNGTGCMVMDITSGIIEPKRYEFEVKDHE